MVEEQVNAASDETWASEAAKLSARFPGKNHPTALPRSFAVFKHLLSLSQKQTIEDTTKEHLVGNKSQIGWCCRNLPLEFLLDVYIKADYLQEEVVINSIMDEIIDQYEAYFEDSTAFLCIRSLTYAGML